MRSPESICYSETNRAAHGQTPPRPAVRDVPVGYGCSGRLQTGLGKESSILTEAADQFEAMAGQLETLLAKPLAQLRGESLQQLRVVGKGKIADLSRLEAAQVVVGLAAAIVASDAVVADEAGRHPGIDKRLQRLV